jgi:hypothetical protein
MPTYAQALNGQVNLNNVNWVGAGVPTPGSLGQTELAHIVAQGWNPAVHADMLQITAHFHNSVVAAHFQWTPTTAGNTLLSGAQLLDGTAHGGECAFVAQALRLLLSAPPPWGLGAAGVTFPAPYTGAHGHGFISNHGAGAIPGAALNIQRPNGTTFPAVRKWDDHKVVQIGAHFYDPCYNTHYAALANMALSQLNLVRDNVRLRDLRDYNWASVGGLIWLGALKASDAFWSNTHTIRVFQAAGGGGTAGFYIDWGEGWKSWSGNYQIKQQCYGPYPANPLVR